jgi:hypothetical protein
MAVFIDLFAVLSQLRGENVSRFKHRVSRSLSTAFEAWQVLFQKTAALLRRHGLLDVWLDVLNQFVGLGRRHADASTGHPMPRLSRLRPSTAVSWCTRPNGRTDGDVEVRPFLDEWKSVCDATMRWLGEQNETDFADVKSRLPGRLAIHIKQSDEADAAIRRGTVSPVLVVGRVVYVWTHPKEGR